MKYITKIILCICSLSLLGGVIFAYDADNFCVNFSDQGRKDLPGLDLISPSYETNVPDITLFEHLPDGVVQQTIQQMYCSETRYMIITRPELGSDANSRAQKTFGYNAQDTRDSPELVTQKVNNQMRVEQSSCAYVQLIQNKDQLTSFEHMSFLLDHARSTQNYIDIYQSFANWEEIGVSSLRRYIIVDRDGHIVSRGTQDTLQDLDNFMQTECVSYNCNGTPQAELDVDGDGTSNTADEDIDNDTLLNSVDTFDIDGDGIINKYDLDIDCDGLRNGHPSEEDIDGDGKNDDEDDDSDGDGEDNEDDEDGDCDGCKGGKKGGDDEDDNGDDAPDPEPLPDPGEDTENPDDGKDGEDGEDEESEEDKDKEEDKADPRENPEENPENDPTDSDGDGISDEQEKKDGTDPTDPNDNIGGNNEGGNSTGGQESSGGSDGGSDNASGSNGSSSGGGAEGSGENGGGGASTGGGSNNRNNRVEDLRVELPYNQGYKDVNIENDLLRARGSDLSLTQLIKQINVYLRVAVILVLMGVIVYAGFLLMTGRGDPETLKKANRALMYAAIGIGVAILAYAIVRIVVNLF